MSTITLESSSESDAHLVIEYHVDEDFFFLTDYESEQQILIDRDTLVELIQCTQHLREE